MVLNATNGQIIAGIVKSEETDTWPGNKIVLYDDPNVSFAGKLTGGIRARAPRGQAAKPAAAPTHGVMGKPVTRPAAPAIVQPESAEPEDDSVPFNKPEAIPAHQH